jgi:hypothetical protein
MRVTQPTGRWPALAVVVYVGLFCVIATAAVLLAVARGSSWADQGVVLLAIGLRLVSIAIALASVQRWGERIPAWVVLAGLWRRRRAAAVSRGRDRREVPDPDRPHGADQ